MIRAISVPAAPRTWCGGPRFLKRGIREINLVAQDVASYGKDTDTGGIAALLDRVLSLDGVYWLRLLYLHPDHVPPELLTIPGRDPRLLPYFDLPFQHASAGILRAMGRRGTPGPICGCCAPSGNRCRTPCSGPPS